MKIITLKSLPLSFDEQDQRTKQNTWSENLPEKFNYYHMEDNMPITIDDQESFDAAVLYNINELNSHIMRLYLAPNKELAL